MATACSRRARRGRGRAASAGCSTIRPRAAPPSSHGWRRSRPSEDPLFFTVIDKASGKVAGRQTLMRIDPANGVIEIGNIYLGTAGRAQAGRDGSAVPVRQIRLRRTRLPPLRVEVQQPQRAVQARRASASAFNSRAFSASIWWSRAKTAIRRGIRSSTRNGRRCGRHMRAGSIPAISIVTETRRGGWKIFVSLWRERSFRYSEVMCSFRSWRP